MFIILLFVAVGGSGLRPFFVASRWNFDGDDRNFVVLLDNRYRVLFDTGGFDFWIKPSTLVDGGYDAEGSTTIAKVSNFIYPFSGNVLSNYSVDEMFTFDRHCNVEWRQEMAIVSSGGLWMTRSVGILGAALDSRITRSLKVFTTVPYPDHFRIYAGPRRLTASHCFSAPLTELGLKLGKWIVSGSIKVGNSLYRATEFEVDTGFSPLALSTNMWKAIKTRMESKGAIYSRIESSDRVHVFRNCAIESIPRITYKFGPGQIISLSSSHFVQFVSNSDICAVHVLAHDTRNIYANVSYIGVPLLASAVVQFNSETKSITFCERKNSIN